MRCSSWLTSIERTQEGVGPGQVTAPAICLSIMLICGFWVLAVHKVITIDSPSAKMSPAFWTLVQAEPVPLFMLCCPRGSVPA